MRTAALAALVFAVCAAAPLAAARSVPVTAEGQRVGSLRVFDFGAADVAAAAAGETVLQAGAPALAASAADVAPAAQVVVKQALLDAIVPNAISLLTDLVTKIQIPEVETTADVAVLGKIDLRLADLKLQSLYVSPEFSHINLETGYGDLNLNDISVEITGHWNFWQRSFPKTSGGGNLWVKMSRGYIYSNIVLDADNEGYVTLDVPNSETHFGNVDVDIKDSAWAWVLNIVSGLFSGTIRNTVADEINKIIRETLPVEATKLFRKQPLSLNVQNLFNVDLGFVKPIRVTPEFLDARNHVRISAIDGTQCPFQTGLPARDHKDSAAAVSKQARAYIDQSALQCAVWAFTEKTALKATIRQSDLPDNIVILNTDSWDELVPIIAQMYPDRPMEVDAAVVGTPQVSLSRAAGGVATLEALLNFFVIEASGARTPLFVLNAGVRVTLDEIKIIQSPDYTKNTVKIALEALDIDTSIVDSSVGEIDIEPIQETFEALGFLAVTILNTDVIPQIDIPEIPYARLIKPIIEYSDGELVVSSNFDIIPQ